MHSIRSKWGLAAPGLVLLAALLVGALVGTRSTAADDFANYQLNSTTVSSFTIPGQPSTVVAPPGIPASVALPYQLPIASGAPAFPDSGQILVYKYDSAEKDGVKIEIELFTYDNAQKAVVDEFHIIARAKKGTAAIEHEAGSIIKLATQLQTKITAEAEPPFDIDVTSTDGFGALGGDDILIDGELFTVDVLDEDTFTVQEEGRAGETSTDQPTPQEQHDIGAIVVPPDTHLFSIARTIHAGDNTLDTLAQTYTRLQPATMPDVAHGSVHPFAIDAFPQSYVAPNPTVLTGLYDKISGSYQLSQIQCTVSAITAETESPTAVSVSLNVTQGDKDPGTQETGTINISLDTEHSAWARLTTKITEGQGVPFSMEADDVSDFAVAGSVIVGAERFTYATRTDTSLNIISRADVGGGPAAQHDATTSAIVELPVCDAVGASGPLHIDTLESAMDAAFDSDRDGCSNWQELGANPQTGGQRDPWNAWDFFDPTQDGAISGLDFFAVLGRFGATDLGKTGPITRNDDPFTTPVPDAPAYHPAFDRGAGPVPGGNSWNTRPADGAVSGLDFFGVLGSFGGNCQ